MSEGGAGGPLEANTEVKERRRNCHCGGAPQLINVVCGDASTCDWSTFSHNSLLSAGCAALACQQDYVEMSASLSECEGGRNTSPPSTLLALHRSAVEVSPSGRQQPERRRWEELAALHLPS